MEPSSFASLGKCPNHWAIGLKGTHVSSHSLLLLASSITREGQAGHQPEVSIEGDANMVPSPQEFLPQQV